MYGWHGQALHIDLTHQTTRTEPISQDLLHAYLGGRGLGVRMFRDHYRLDPFAAEMPLIFAAGPLCGSAAPATARLAIVSRSPLTGTMTTSLAGGAFARRLKQAGYDALVISGHSARPVTLRIDPAGTKFEDATQLWGATTTETVRALHPHGSVAAIGPAGENRVLFASLLFDGGNAVGRGGLGAVMGSKNLKAIAIDGDRQVKVANPARVQQAQQDILRLFKASPVLCGELGLAEFGTPAFVDLMAQRRMTPTENFRRTFFDGSGSYSGPTIRNTLAPVKAGCPDCPVACLQASDGNSLPAYEALSHLGALLGNRDLRAIVAANTLCNELGMDVLSAAATLAVRGELHGRFPAAGEIAGLLRDTAYRRGEGDQLALGARRMASEFGREDVAMTVKSLELPAYDPRGAYGMALAYCTSNHGGCHLPAYPISHEILRKPVATDRFSFAGKGRMIKIAEDSNAVVDSLVACRFAFLGASLEEYAEAFNGVTGLDFTAQDLKGVGERIYQTERFYNQQNGFDAGDDMLPDRFFREAGSSGDGFEIAPLDRTRFLEERSRYYRIRGLDEQGRFDNDDFLAGLP